MIRRGDCVCTSLAASAVSAVLWSGNAAAIVTTEPYPIAGPTFTSASAAAALSGWTAMANSRSDIVELRDASRTLRRTIARAELSALVPWMSFNTDADGPCSLALSDSGRHVYIGVCDSNTAPDGQPGDAVLRYDTYTDQLTLFHSAELGGFNTTPRPMLAHFKGRLYLGFGTTITTLNARMNDATSSVVSTATFGSASTTTALAIDRLTSTMYVASGTQLSRTSIASSTLSFTSVGTLPASARALAWSDHYGGASQAGLYVAYGLPGSPTPTTPLIGFVTPAMARSTVAFAPSVYFEGTLAITGLGATCSGELLLAQSAGDGLLLRDSNDPRLTFAAWTADEFQQVVRLTKGLISPDGQPAGWVIDADVIPAWSRFHPATPDAAAWAVLILLMNDHLNHDPQSLPLVRTILTRYAGLAADGIRPSRTADGIYRHWIDPLTGGVKPGWDPEYATMSTMKIVAAAARAAAYAPDDPAIRAAAREIICGVSNWDGYFDFSGRTYLKGLVGGGRDNTSASTGWHESVIFAEQAGVYGSTLGPQVSQAWLNRAFWPTGTLVTGRGVTSTLSNTVQASFLSLYPLLLIDRYRTDPAWQTNIVNLRLNHAAWNDDNGPRYYTVFSAGTTKSIWGGYNADSLTSHPGDVATFPSLMAMTAAGGTAINEQAAAYHAYRNGARQTFKSGASILYRKSQVDPAYVPDSAGMPDVVLGALGLAEALQPGSVATVLTGAYPSCNCPSDWNSDGGVDGADVEAFFASWEAGEADLNADGGTDGADVGSFFGFWEAGC